jgi:hypothetical protein
LNLRSTALWVLLTHKNRQICKVGILGGSFGKIFLTYQVEDKVGLGHYDATKCNTEGKEGRK